MHLSKKLLKEFENDIESISERCQVRKGAFRVDLMVDCDWRHGGVAVLVYEENGFTKKDSYDRAKKFVSNYNNIKSSFLKKWSGILDECDKNGARASVAGEGEYPQDYSMCVEIYFKFGSKVDCVSSDCFGKYLKSKLKLCDFLKSLTNISEHLIKDNEDGVSCTVGDYFKYIYSTGEIVPVGRVRPYDNEIKELSNLIGGLFEKMSVFGVPIQYVRVDYRVPYNKSKGYFMKVSKGEYILLYDAIRYKNFLEDD